MAIAEVSLNVLQGPILPADAALGCAPSLCKPHATDRVLCSRFLRDCSRDSASPPFSQTHYGLLTDDLAYHPNVRNMHMQTHVDEEKREVCRARHGYIGLDSNVGAGLQVLPLYKLIPGRAESSYGTRESLSGSAHTARRPADRDCALSQTWLISPVYR